MRIGLGQINPTLGDIAGNAEVHLLHPVDAALVPGRELDYVYVPGVHALEDLVEDVSPRDLL